MLAQEGCVRLTQPVFFATNRDVIPARSFRALRAVGRGLRATPEIRA